MEIALNSENVMIQIQDAEKNLYYKCPICHDPVLVARGDEREYFRHLNGRSEECELKVKQELERLKEMSISTKQYKHVEKSIDISMLNSDQINAYNMAIEWINESKNKINNNKNIFVISGRAGTGKTFLLSKIKDYMFVNGLQYNFMSYTGKACDVLKQKGIEDASTIHSTIYKPKIDRNGNVYGWNLNDENVQDFMIIDEYSFLDDEIIDDLFYFDKPILFCGDDKQLKSINECTIDLSKKTNVYLNEIVRQAQGNPIIKNCNKIRDGILPRKKFIDKNDKGTFMVLKSQESVAIKNIFKFDQIITGTNRKRHELNSIYRQKMGYKNYLPQIGERLICLKNRNEISNGQQFTVKDVGKSIEIIDNQRCIDIKFEEFPDRYFQVSIELFLNKKFNIHKRIFKKGVFNKQEEFYKISFFDFAYAISGHKSQGSEWDNVLIFANDAYWLKDKYKNWLYTATSRSRKNCVVLI